MTRAARSPSMGPLSPHKPGYENHPMTKVTWFGAWDYCGYYGCRLPTEMEWEKAARGTDDASFPLGRGDQPQQRQLLRQPRSVRGHVIFGSRTTPVGFYNGKTYGDYHTLDLRQPLWAVRHGWQCLAVDRRCLRRHALPLTCAAVQRIPTTWTCASGCATMPRPPISVPALDSAACGRNSICRAYSPSRST